MQYFQDSVNDIINVMYSGIDVRQLINNVLSLVGNSDLNTNEIIQTLNSLLNDESLQSRIQIIRLYNLLKIKYESLLDKDRLSRYYNLKIKYNTILIKQFLNIINPHLNNPKIKNQLFEKYKISNQNWLLYFLNHLNINQEMSDENDSSSDSINKLIKLFDIDISKFNLNKEQPITDQVLNLQVVASDLSSVVKMFKLGAEVDSFEKVSMQLMKILVNKI